MKFPCSGQVISAEFFATSSSPFYISFWQKSLFSEKIALKNVLHINTNTTGKQKVEFKAPITVEEEDFIGVSTGDNEEYLTVPYGLRHEYGVPASELASFTKISFDLTKASTGQIINIEEMQHEEGVFAICLKYVPHHQGYIHGKASSTCKNYYYSE